MTGVHSRTNAPPGTRLEHTEAHGPPPPAPSLTAESPPDSGTPRSRQRDRPEHPPGDSGRTTECPSTANHPRPAVVITGTDGRPLAGGEIESVDPSVARASLYVAAGQLPPGTRARLADALFDALETSGRRHVQVTLPIGDAELLDCIRTRCAGGQARAAGTTCLFEAALPPARTNRQK